MNRVRDFMSDSIEKIQASAAAEAAWNAMKAAKIHHLVVMEDGRMVGIISERDLGGVRGINLRSNRVVSELMTPSVVSVSPRSTLREAANLLRGRSIGCLPVVEQGKLVGIVTTTDLLELLGRGLQRPAPKGERPNWRRNLKTQVSRCAEAGRR